MTGGDESVPALDQQLLRLLEAFPGAIWATDLELRVLLLLGSDLKALGVRPEDVLGKTISEFSGSDDPSLPVIAAHRTALDGEVGTYRHTFGGQLRQGRVEPVRDSSGAIVGLVGMSVNITGVEASEIAARESRALTDAVVRSALDAVIVMNSAGEFV